MSQTPPPPCTQCGTPIGPGQRFCPNCGATAPQQIDPTVAAAPYQNMPSGPGYANAGTPSNPNYNAGYPNVGTPSSANYPGAGTPSGNSYPSYSNQSNPSQPNYAPYPDSGVNAGSGVQQAYTAYNTPPVPPAPPVMPYYAAPAKKRSPLAAILIGLLVLVLVAGGGVYLATRGHGGGVLPGTNGVTPTYAATQNLNLTVVYSSDQITFTSVQQKDKFPDDVETTFSFGGKKNYIRLSFSEKQTAQDSSYFSYRSSFLLTLPDKTTTAKAMGAQAFSAPESGVQRTNWVDFETNTPVDLSKLAITLGGADEAQETFALQNGANVAQYNPKTVSPNAQFQYAGLNWTLKAVSQSLYMDGKQAKTGQVYINVDLTADNNSQDTTVYLAFGGGFVRLAAGSSVLSPEYSSSLDKFDIIDPNTKGVEGIAIFLATPTSDGKYTLNFQAGDGFSAQTQAFQIS